MTGIMGLVVMRVCRPSAWSRHDESKRDESTRCVMLLVFDESDSRLTTRRAGLWQRLAVCLRASRLDREIAAGASPDITADLALRAQALVRMSVRHDLAKSVQRIVDSSTGATVSGRPRVPLCPDRVTEARDELQVLIEHLRTPGPVAAQGVAQARVLLSDGSGPLYHRGSRDDLRTRVHQAVDALNPLRRLDDDAPR
jgi:hypothetical protein